jgi:hypothetical protein
MAFSLFGDGMFSARDRHWIRRRTAMIGSPCSMLAAQVACGNPGWVRLLRRLLQPGTGSESAWSSGYNPAVAANDFVFVAGNMAFRADGTPDPKVCAGRGQGSRNSVRC